MKSVKLNNDLVRLRALEPTDLDVLYGWENDASLWVVTDTVAPYSRQVLWHYLENDTADIYQSRQLRLMVTLAASGEPVGTVDFFNFNPLNNRAEMGLYITPEHRGEGLGRAALDALCSYARDHIGLRQLYIYVAIDNVRSLSLFDQYGFRRVGTLQKWVKRGHRYTDAILLQLVF